MKKRLWRILLGVSSCLLVAVVVLWVRSVSDVDKLYWRLPRPDADDLSTGEFALESQRSRLAFYFRSFPAGYEKATGLNVPERGFRWSTFKHMWNGSIGPLDYWYARGDPNWFGQRGFHANRQVYSGNEVNVWLVCVPHWFLVALFSIPLLIQCRRWYIRRDRYKTGLCQSCGYDLRASVDRCPECGSVIAAAPIGSDPAAG